MADPATTEDYDVVFASQSGIRVLRDLIEFSGFLSVFPTGADHQLLAHQNGTRAVFAQVYAILMSTPRGREAMAEALRPAASQE